MILVWRLEGLGVGTGVMDRGTALVVEWHIVGTYTDVVVGGSVMVLWWLEGCQYHSDVMLGDWVMAWMWLMEGFDDGTDVLIGVLVMDNGNVIQDSRGNLF